MSHAFPILLKATDPDDLLRQVRESLHANRDLYTPLFVSEDGLLCQFVVNTICIYEYKLIIANDLDAYEQQVQLLNELDFDFIFNVVMWNGKYLQWMQRMNETGKTVRDAVVSVALAAGSAAMDTDIQPADRADELQLVEDVQRGLRLEPISLVVGGIPYPLRLS